MSGTSIPLAVQPMNPFIGSKQYSEAAAESLQPSVIGSEIAQRQAQTGLIGQQTTAAAIQNRLGLLNLAIQEPYMTQMAAAMNGSSYSGNAGLPWSPAPATSAAPPGATSTGIYATAASAAGGGTPAPSGAPLAQGRPDYVAPDMTGPNGVMLPGLGFPVPRQWGWGFLQAQDKAKAAVDLQGARRSLLGQIVQSTVGQNGQVNPALWDQAVRTAFDQGLITSQDAWTYYGHPELGQNMINGLLPAGETPAVRGAQAAATSGAAEAAKAPYTMQTRVVETSPGHYQSVTKPLNQWMQPGAGQQAPAVTPSTVSDALTGTEASPANAVSPRGAAGTRQIMPATFQQYALPGENFNNEADRVRVSNRVIDDLWRQYPNDPERVAVGYFSGPGNIAPPGAPTPWKANTSDGNMPVSQYVSNFMQRLGGGAAPAQASAGGGGGGATAGAVAVGPPEPTVPQQKTMDVEQGRIAKDQDTVTDAQTGALRAQGAMPVIYDALRTLPNVSTGSMGAERLAVSNFLQTFAPDAANKFITWATNNRIDPSNAADMQKFVKETFNQVTNAEQQLGGARVGAMLTKYFQQAMPNINMQGPAIREMFNFLLVGNQMARDYAEGAAAHFNSNYGSWTADPLSNRYTPLTAFDQGWDAADSVHAPAVYEAASNLLNGRGWNEWTKGLSPAQRQEAAMIVKRADPAWQPAATQWQPAQPPAPAAPPAIGAPPGTQNATAR